MDSFEGVEYCGAYLALAKNLGNSKIASRSERFFTTFRMTFWVMGINFNTRTVKRTDENDY